MMISMMIFLVDGNVNLNDNKNMKLSWRKVIPDTHGGIRCHYLQRITAVVFLCLCLGSCGQISWKDVSSTSGYSSVIGKQFKTKKELWAFGITTRGRNYKKKVDYILLMDVRIGGPEVLTRERIDSGFVFRVVKILKAKFSLISRKTYVVKAVDSDKFKGHEVLVDLTGDFNDGNYGLDKSVYSLEN